MCPCLGRAHRWLAGSQPLAVCPCAHLPDGATQLLPEVPFTGGLSDPTPTACWAPGGPSRPAHHRSPPSQSPWKTQCAQSNQFWLDVSPWNVKASTECGNGVVLILEPSEGNVVLSRGGATGGLPGPPVLPLATVSNRMRWDCSGWKILQRQR